MRGTMTQDDLHHPARITTRESISAASFRLTDGLAATLKRVVPRKMHSLLLKFIESKPVIPLTKFHAGILCAFVGMCACLSSRVLGVDQPGSAQSRPNVLLITADDQSYKTISCYDAHPAWVSTPNIDSLAREGIRFERAYLGAWCMPSRASILTGRLQHGIQSMRMEGTYPASTYDPQRCPFIAAEFRKQGYHTAQIGKWHTGTDAGWGRDWDYQVVWNRPAYPSNAGNYYSDQILVVNGVEIATAGYSTDNYTDWAVKYIQGNYRSADKPWLLWLCYGAVHGPTTPAKRHQGALRGKPAPIPKDIFGPWQDKPAYLNATYAWEKNRVGQPAMRAIKHDSTNYNTNEVGLEYDAWIQQVNECNMALDEGVGRIIQSLRDSGQLENTLVIYTADQGYGLGEHGFNQKVAPYDATIASPLIIRQPGQVSSGKVCPHPVNAPDLVDLICRTAGVTIPWQMDGRDIRPLLADPQTNQWDAPMLMTHTARSFGSATDQIPVGEQLMVTAGVPWYVLLRDGHFKYIRYLLAGEIEELYDLKNDPEELRNLAYLPEQQVRMRDLRAKTIQELRRTGAQFVDTMPQPKAR